MGEQGQVYVKVQAQDTGISTFSMKAAGSASGETGGSGQTSFSATIKWETPNGITNVTWIFKGVEIPHYDPSNPNHDEINTAINNVVKDKGLSLGDMLRFPNVDCFIFH